MAKREFMTMAERKAQNIELPFRGFIVGAPGSGKSSSASFMANALDGIKEGRVIFIDANGESLAGCEMFLDSGGIEKFIHVPIYAENLDVKGSKAAGDGSMTGQILDVLDDLEEQGLLNDRNTHIFVDGITDICNDLMRINHKKSTSTGNDDMLRTYGAAQNAFVEFYGKLIKATKKSSLWIFGHLEKIQVDGGKPEWGLDAITKSYSKKILNSPGISNLFVYKKDVSRDGKVEFKVILKPTHDMPFIKNVCATYDGVPVECDQEWFLPSFVECSRTKKWTYPVKKLSG